VIDIPIGIDHEPASLKEQILVYPNPSDGIFIVRTGRDFDASLIEIIDQIGRVVFMEKVDHQPYAEVQATGLNEGIYFLRVCTKKGMAIIERIAIQ